MQTAKLELIDPYAKYGLKRRPTYDEIAGLIHENQALAGALPDRDATFFKNTPQGSFFDGMDSMEILREQQSRIQNRQMRDIVLRQQAAQGGTYNLDRHQGTTMITDDFEDATSQLGDGAMSEHGAGVRARLQQTMSGIEDRRQQTRQSHSANQQAQDQTVFQRMINSRPAIISMASDDDDELEDI